MKNFKPWKKYPLIAGELAEVDTLIQHTIQTPHQSLQAALLTMADNSGNIYAPAFYY